MIFVLPCAIVIVIAVIKCIEIIVDIKMAQHKGYDAVVDDSGEVQVYDLPSPVSECCEDVDPGQPLYPPTCTEAQHDTVVNLIELDSRHNKHYIDVPKGYSFVDINIASNISNSYKPVWCKIYTYDKRLFATYAVTGNCNYIATNPCPNSSKLMFEVDDIQSGLLTSAKVFISVLFYDKKEMAQPVRVVNDDLSVKIKNMPIWTTTRTIVPALCASDNVVQDFINNQDLVKAGVYIPSKVAYIMDGDGDMLYSVNYTYLHHLNFSRDTILHHQPFLEETCPMELQLVKCSVIVLNINELEVNKLQVLYKRRVINADAEGSEIMFYDCTTSDKDSLLWDYLCES